MQKRGGLEIARRPIGQIGGSFLSITSSTTSLLMTNHTDKHDEFVHFALPTLIRSLKSFFDIRMYLSRVSSAILGRVKRTNFMSHNWLSNREFLKIFYLVANHVTLCVYVFLVGKSLNKLRNN